MSKLSFNEFYRKSIADNGWIVDENQLKAVHALERFGDEFIEKHSQSTKSIWRLLHRESKEPTKGVYLYGSVGRGKTYIMDLLVEYLAEYNPVRLHFHRFMVEVHDELKKQQNQSDPLAIVARKWAKKSKLLCFDEFFVSDIADAMILGRFVSKLFEQGVSLITTSNIAPQDLYKDGLSRELFVPAINAIVKRCDIVHMDQGCDYRMREQEEVRSWFGNSGNELKQFSELFYKLAGTINDERITVIYGRTIKVTKKGANAAWFQFDDLCRGHRSAADYIELTKRFHWLFVENMKSLSEQDEDTARRFVALVDEAYDRRVKLIISANCALEEWYQGKKLEFISKRTLSRLNEMQSVHYWQQSHLT